MAAGQAFTVKTTFGIPIGPTYAGAVTVQPPAGGNNQPLIDQVITHSGSEQQIYEAVDHTKLQGFGFTAKLLALNGNVGTPAIVLKFKAAGPAAADLTYTLHDGESVAFPINTLTGDATSVKVLPDTTSDFQITGMLVLTS